MVHVNLTIAFALVTGTGAGVLALLSWEIFRQSPVGRAIFALAVVMSSFVIYDTIVLALGADLFVARVIKSGIYTVLVAFIGLMIDAQRRIRPESNASSGESR